MFKNLDSDSEIEAVHTRSGRVFQEVHLANMFKKNYGEEGFYSGEEAELTDEEHLEPTGIEEGKDKELRQGEPKTYETTPTIKVSTGIPPNSVVLSNQINPSHQSVLSTINSSPPHIQSGTLGRSMADEMRLPIFRGDVFEDPDQHWFLCEVVWNIKNVTDEAVK
jgi:hypothetical protein